MRIKLLLAMSSWCLLQLIMDDKIISSAALAERHPIPTTHQPLYAERFYTMLFRILAKVYSYSCLCSSGGINMCNAKAYNKFGTVQRMCSTRSVDAHCINPAHYHHHHHRLQHTSMLMTSASVMAALGHTTTAIYDKCTYMD